ncbi:hypothetical protein ElyMa_003540300 [Elysia marginata]|uniref:Uncharacterized protein n=1 Tax=Elysia marginata TaxID=1093978 RepID=A0AAV4EJ86_9GAST|nr:hypothetical protein ElyMa_003540300 [Elysia marginata]
MPFRCIAAHQTGTRRCVEARARALFHQWTDTSVDDFEGVTLRELDELEDVFRVDIDVFEFNVCSNVPGFENPICLISEGDPQNLVDRMGEEISTSAFQILRETCFKEAFEYLETLREDDVKDKPHLKGTLFKYVSQLPVVGFNSGKYDLNVIKHNLAQRFFIPKDDDYDSEGEDGGGFRQTRKRFVIKKKNNEFMAISTPLLKFLNITNFIAPDFSYAKYLAAYEVEEQKGFFPYEYITCIEKLEETSLPPREAFYSSLRNSELSHQNYDHLCEVWREKGVKSLRDFLFWYNNEDTRPFIEALKNSVIFIKPWVSIC